MSKMKTLVYKICLSNSTLFRYASATFVRDAAGHSEMVFDVELPAIDMGITFRDTGAKGPAVVESLKPGGAVQVERS
jgi:hypothetical protein